MFKKIILFLLFAMMIVGAVSAADQTSFKTPTNFEDIGDGVYVLYDSFKNADEILSVVKYNAHDWKDYITNDTSKTTPPINMLYIRIRTIPITILTAA